MACWFIAKINRVFHFIYISYSHRQCVCFSCRCLLSTWRLWRSRGGHISSLRGQPTYFKCLDPMIHGPWQCLSQAVEMAQAQDTETTNQIAVCRKCYFNTLKVLQSKFMPNRWNTTFVRMLLFVIWVVPTKLISNDIQFIQQLLPCRKVESVYSNKTNKL